MQIRLDSGPVKNSVLDQALGSNNRSAESCFYRIILEASQGLAEEDILSQSKDMQLLSSQEASKNPIAMSIKNSIKVDAPSSNEKFGKKDKIIAEIEQLKKEQKKTQIKFELYCLKEHVT